MHIVPGDGTATLSYQYDTVSSCALYSSNNGFTRAIACSRIKICIIAYITIIIICFDFFLFYWGYFIYQGFFFLRLNLYTQLLI